MTERRRRPRRAVRPPTAAPRERPAEPADDFAVSADDQDEGWAGSGEAARTSSGEPDDRDERWWREQRPPHWE
ncbi:MULTISPECIES: hypothetical protein [Allobranchiibius]|uniref:Uncharacterized protein n=1 Tax=Allobranchiibius huperziae TaxID=1874116 RepID=A0A853D9M2_9MICO|nr:MULTISPECIES: hypothetical protein [Allobranchiibius]MBO1765914.1 hypothetical protein [Allobranchiibius sp. GilTou38]NYJ73658.1 hypothetical protein [Allobranchiibius huperziae]